MKRFLLVLALGILNLDASFADNIIDVLMVYTPAVEDEHTDADGVEALVISAFESANDAFAKSETETQLRLVGVRKVDYVEDADDMGTDLERLSEQDGVMDSVLQWRSDLGADLVCLVRHEWVDSTAGIAWLLNDPNGRSSAGFSVVASRSLMVGATFQHEIGHNLGAGHDRENTGDATPLFDFSYGHRFKYGVGIEYRTLMAYNPGSLINLFSNPDVTYFDTPVGVASGAEAADNARTIRLSAPHVASYYAAVNQAPVAEAGVDITVVDANGNGFETVFLDGSASESDAGISTWNWTWESGSASGEHVTVTLPVGQTVVTLEVTDESSMKATDTVTVEIFKSPGASQVYSGERFTFILKEDGKLLATGDNSNGQLGIGSLAAVQSEFVELELSNVEAVSAGQSHTLFLLSDGRVFGAGSNAYGQLGEYPAVDYANPTIIDAEGVVSVAAGDRFSLFLLDDGSVVGMGSSPGGTVGEAGVEDAVSLVELIVEGVEMLVVGGDFAAALKTNGSVLVWGAMGDVLEEGGDVAMTTPVTIMENGASAIASGQAHLLILSESGEVFALGRNSSSGALAAGRNGDVFGVNRILESGADAIWTTDYASYIRLESGEVLGAGVPLLNVFGEFDPEPEYELVSVFSAPGVTVAGGSDYLIVNRPDGVVHVLGSNELGQLGYGETSQVSTVSEIAFGYNASEGGEPPVSVAAIPRERVAILENGSVRIRLDGSASSDDWFIERYLWTWDGGSVDGRLASVEFSEGESEVRLSVYDQNGNESVDTFTVLVRSFDDWLALFFTPLEISEMDSIRSFDFDGDGLSNADEALLGLDPSDFGSRLKFGYVNGPDDLRIYLEGVPSDLSFTLEGSSDAESWSSIPFDVLPSDADVLWLDWEDTEAKLFRVEVTED